MTKEEKYKLSRFMYSIGSPIISDKEYDELEKEIDGDQRTDYNADEIPTELLIRVYGEEKAKTLISSLNKKTINLDRYVSRSMLAYRTLEECYKWLEQHHDIEFCVSPKIDGVNTTTLYKNGVLRYSRTRGRLGDPDDITENVSKVLPNSIGDLTDDFVLAGEAVYTADDLIKVNSILQSYSNVPIITPRGGARSVLKRNIYPDEVYDSLNVLIFRSNYGETVYDSLEYAKSLGFKTVPHERYTFKYQDFNEFKDEITSLIWKYKVMVETQGIPTDGLVLQINKRKFFDTTINDGFIESGCLAVKAIGWEEGVYQSEVTNIIIEPSTFQCCVKVVVKPVMTDSGKQLSVINLFNPSVLFNNKIKIGSIIEFNYKNETTINFIRKIE